MVIRVIGSNHLLLLPSRLQQVVADKEQIFARLLSLQTRKRIRGAILLTTCNRLEIVVDTEQVDDPRLVHEILDAKADTPIHEASEAEAAHYLLRVASGLESMARGEDQILGQIREAFKTAERHDLLSPQLRLLRTQLVAAARDTRCRTGMSKSKVSVASLAVRQLQQSGRRLVVVGAGETGRLAVETLIKRGFTDLLIVNRTLLKAQNLARHFGVRAMRLSDFLTACEHNDPKPWHGVLFAVDSHRPIFFDRHARGLRMVVDVSMPSILDASVHSVPGLEVMDLDTIARCVQEEGRRREASLKVADELVKAKAKCLHRSLAEAESGTSVRFAEIFERDLDTAMQELQTVLSTQLGHLSHVDQETVRQLVLRSTRRNAHFHLKEVKELSRSSGPPG
ncbi:MAG: glutamyl-tRNA reductase [Planctomycetota bacterium]|jgi:glutamyl-tRNA reductase